MSHYRSSFEGTSPSSSQQSLELYRTDSADSAASTSTLASSVSSDSSLRWSSNPSTLSQRRKNVPRPLDTSAAHTRKKIFPLAAQAKQRKQKKAEAAAAAAAAETRQFQATESQLQPQPQTQTQSTTPPNRAARPVLRIDTANLPSFTSRRRPAVNASTFVEPKVPAPPPVVPVPAKARGMRRQTLSEEERQQERKKTVPGLYTLTVNARDRREARPLPALPSLHEMGYEKNQEPFRTEKLKSLASGIRGLKQPGDDSLSYFTMNLEHLEALIRDPPSIGFLTAEMAVNMLEELRAEYNTTRYQLTQIGMRGGQQFDSWITDTRAGAGGSAVSIVEGEEIAAAKLLKYMETLLKCGQWVREQRDKSVAYEKKARYNMRDLRNRSVVGLILAGAH